jgi:hypothetical protein
MTMTLAGPGRRRPPVPETGGTAFEISAVPPPVTPQEAFSALGPENVQPAAAATLAKTDNIFIFIFSFL